jgi:ABC-type sugar transport system ATPase subunit
MRYLSVAETQLVEIVKAISLKSKIVIMDEPTSAITEKEVQVLFEQIERLKGQGVAIIYISHKMDEIFKIADQITVLRDGALAGSGAAAELDGDKLISMMVGREIKQVYPKEATEILDVVLEVQDLNRGKKVKDVSFRLHGGEVLGIAGLVGSGRSELVETIFGIRPATSGKIFVKGQAVTIRHPKEAIAHKIAMITEDRKQTGLNLKTSVEQNISLVSIKKLSRAGIIDKGQESEAADRYIKSLSIKTHSRKAPIISLSGGNQQKVVLAKWLLSEPDIIIFDEPTRGIDVGAKRDIYLLIGELAKQGKGIIVISSEMPEVMGISDRILVMSEGAVAGELNRDEFSQETIMNYASARGGKKS